MACPEEFFTGYVTTALWSSDDDNGVPLDRGYSESDIAPASLAKMRADCDAFYEQNQTDLNCEGVTFVPDFGQDRRAGYDFWLTRNRHGAGFWDGDWPQAEGDRLMKAAHRFGEVDIYIGNDNQIWCD